MKNKIVFPKNDAIQTRQLVNQASTRSLFDENLNPKVEGMQRIKASKIIKGKVKIYSSKNEEKFVNNDWLGDDAELDIVSKRMSLFLKFTFVCLTIISLLILFKKDVL